MVSTENLVSYYKLDESSGNAIDSHGSNDLANSANQNVAGIINTGYYTYTSPPLASGQCSGATSGLPAGDTDFSVNFWAHHDSVGANRHMVGWQDVNDNNRIQMWVDGSVYFFRSEDVMQGWSTGVTPGTNSYEMVTWTYDSTTNYITLYVSGAFAASSAITYTGTAGSNLSLFKNSAGNYPYLGFLDELSIWTGRVLTSSEISDLYNGGAGLSYDSLTSNTNLQVNVDDTFKSVAALKVNVDDAWKEVTAAKVNVDDAWKSIF
jgi:hypothetical protein|tara:strand:+ start:4527 stop:5318 length:792 start_codon:yes stop_codon:yes gene_type:complete